ncbi:MAG: peptide deformylase [Firmicutes bacterium]|nr:peptide deformylase [Bacillota bacterium]
MSLRRVVTHSEIDRSPALAVESIDDDCLALARDLLDTMYASPGCVGLAAPQIGVPLRAFSVNVTGHKKTQICHGEMVLFNPKVLSGSDPVMAREGCMSVPELTGDVVRFENLSIVGIGLKGEEVVLETNAFEARALQHEIDHLDGLLFLDRLAGPGALHARKVYK